MSCDASYSEGTFSSRVSEGFSVCDLGLSLEVASSKLTQGVVVYCDKVTAIKS